MTVFDLPPWLFALPAVWGVNFIFWGTVGLFRAVHDWLLQRAAPLSRTQEKKLVGPMSKNEVVAVVPAHNESLVIASTLDSLLRLLPASNIFVVSDGSTDDTASRARDRGVAVLELEKSHGKAGALQAGLEHFSLLQNFSAVLFVDADTVLKEDYLENALPFFRDRRVVAIAGYARTLWQPRKMSWVQRFIILHRDRVYFLSQTLLKFGQTWRHTNVTSIVPGFASIYRSSALAKINLNPPGLVIEDFNMTFEIHHKHLGLVAHHPRITGYTQDPDNLRDYRRQIARWNLGFWQTVRLHGFWPSKFWAALALLLTEVSLSSVLILMLAATLITWFTVNLGLIIFGGALPSWFLELATLFSGRRLPNLFLYGVFLPDYLLAIVAAFVMRRPQYLLVGLGSFLMRVVDSLSFIAAIPRAFFVKSSGQWTSPTRR